MCLKTNENVRCINIFWQLTVSNWLFQYLICYMYIIYIYLYINIHVYCLILYCLLSKSRSEPRACFDICSYFRYYCLSIYNIAEIFSFTQFKLKTNKSARARARISFFSVIFHVSIPIRPTFLRRLSEI